MRDEHRDQDRAPSSAASPAPNRPCARRARAASAPARRAARRRGPAGAGEAAEAGCSWTHATARVHVLDVQSTGRTPRRNAAPGPSRASQVGDSIHHAGAARFVTVTAWPASAPGPAARRAATAPCTYQYGSALVWLDDLTRRARPARLRPVRPARGAPVGAARLAPRGPTVHAARLRRRRLTSPRRAALPCAAGERRRSCRPCACRDAPGTRDPGRVSLARDVARIVARRQRPRVADRRRERRADGPRSTRRCG